MFLGKFNIDDVITFAASTHTASTGAATDADAVPAYRVYEDETGTAILTGNMAKLDDANTMGFYSEQLTLSAANGFENGKSYTVYISAAVSSVTGTMHHTFTVGLQKVDVTHFGGSAGTFSGGRPEVNTTHAAGTAWASGAITAAVIATGAIDADAIAADAITDAKVASDVTIASVTGAVGSVTGNVGGNVTGSVGSVVGAVGSVTGNVGGNVTGSVGSLATQAKADVNTEVDTAIADARLDELLNADSDIDGAAPPTVGSVFHELMSKTAGSFTFDQTTDSVEALRDRGDAAWTTATGFSTHSAADVWSVVARTLTAATNITSTGGTTVPQTGDSYAIVNSGTHGNAALKTLIDTIDDLLDTEIAAIKAETDKIDATIPDSVPSDGTRPTPRQALYMIVQFLLERAVSGTTVTVKKVDGSTSLMTCTLNDATSPTSITRAT